MTISTSPEQYKNLQRSGSNLASNFAASLTRPFAFSTPDSSSPPTVQPRKRLSPATSYMGGAASSQVWGALVSSKKNTPKPQQPRAWSLPPTSGSGPGGVDGKTAGFATKLKNQSRFHNDGYASEPLLNPARTEHPFSRLEGIPQQRRRAVRTTLDWIFVKYAPNVMPHCQEKAATKPVRDVPKDKRLSSANYVIASFLVLHLHASIAGMFSTCHAGQVLRKMKTTF
ncbi:MAG: hypothetical protein LQ350_005738 [Teloschistes chrysophthalmus]|nr:MAG: hypothetical protein LQ350_005738 [Niorma chrysophthalma]